MARRPSATIHAQTRVEAGDFGAEVDEELAPLIRELWIAGIETIRSCEEYPMTGKVLIEFATIGGAEGFLNAVAVHQKKKKRSSLWSRANDWGFYQSSEASEHIDRRGDWEYYATVMDY